MNNDVFGCADILVYQGGDQTSQEAFSVVACDQYTSEPDYWRAVEKTVEGRPSALHLIFPEAYLKNADFDGRISSINQAMSDYLSRGLFLEYPNCLFYVERTLRGGMVRRGLIGKLDLEEYDYESGSQTKIRATEGTVLSRIPPRVKIREGAPLELPHVMILIDDLEKSVIEPLQSRTECFKRLYSFELMERSGSLSGYLLPEEECRRVLSALRSFGDRAGFERRYGVTDPCKGVLQFAVGDGNHSLATAKKCYLNLKERIGEEAAKSHPSRYALVELVNLHDDSLTFEAIHRIVTGVSPSEVEQALYRHFQLSETPIPDAQWMDLVTAGNCRRVYLRRPTRNLSVGSLQDFLDEYLSSHSGVEVDYIHGEDVVRELSKLPDSIGFLLPCMKKEQLFPTVILDGALPRKTFSMGEACDKRFYFEARKIR